MKTLVDVLKENGWEDAKEFITIVRKGDGGGIAVHASEELAVLFVRSILDSLPDDVARSAILAHVTDRLAKLNDADVESVDSDNESDVNKQTREEILRELDS